MWSSARKRENTALKRKIMPPKIDTQALLRPEMRVFIKPHGAPDSEFVECGFCEDTSLASRIADRVSEKKEEWGHATRFTMQFRVNIKRKTLRSIMQRLGFWKAPKCTYRTIKRDCAKRNRI